MLCYILTIGVVRISEFGFNEKIIHFCLPAGWSVHASSISTTMMDATMLHSSGPYVLMFSIMCFIMRFLLQYTIDLYVQTTYHCAYRIQYAACDCSCQVECMSCCGSSFSFNSSLFGKDQPIFPRHLL